MFRFYGPAARYRCGVSDSRKTRMRTPLRLAAQLRSEPRLHRCDRLPVGEPLPHRDAVRLDLHVTDPAMSLV